MSKWKEKLAGLRKDQLLIVILSGVLLLVVAWPVSGETKKSAAAKEKAKQQSVSGTEDSEAGIMLSGENKNAEYTAQMEEKLENLLSGMEHAGRVEVIISLKSSEEKVVEKDIPVTRSNTQEQDSQGGSRDVSQMDSKETTIYETDSQKSTPYVIKTNCPQVEGVVVVCEGAGVGNVSKNITEAIEVLFGIEPHKIKVVKMKTS